MNYWQDKNVLVTGCTGIIGSWLTRELVARGASVIGIIRDHVGYSNIFKNNLYQQINAAFGDITDYHFVSRVMAEYEVDTVFHLAAQTIVSIANRSPLSTFESNIKGTWVLLEACRLSPTVERVVVASSDKAYGCHEQLPYTEDYALKGNHPYDVSKSCADMLAQAYYNTYRLSVAISRLANVYGGGDLNFNRIVPGTIKAVLEDRPPVIRSDGSPLREYMFVADAVEAYICLAENLHRQDVAGQAFNFGPSRPNTVLEITEEIIRVSGKNFSPEIRGRGIPMGEIKDQYCDCNKSKTVLGWEPKYNLELGLRETYKWYKDYFKGVKTLG